MPSAIDLTPFGFTPTESRVYGVLLVEGPGSGYAIARAAGLARANAYSALEGLVGKGAARVEDGRPKRYRPEPPEALLARISNRQGDALELLTAALGGIAVQPSPTVVEIDSPRGALQVIAHDMARATVSVALLAPPEAYPLLTPALRRAVGMGLPVSLSAVGSVALDFATVDNVPRPSDWPGLPLIAVVDDRSAVLAARRDNLVHGHWSTAPTFVAAARLILDRFRTSS